MVNGNVPEVPGTYGQVKFPITASLILGIVVVAITALFYRFPSQRETLKFGIEAATLAAGVLSAYYVGQGLLEGARQRERGLRDAKIAMAFRYCERWNDPRLARTKDTFRTIINSGKAHDAGYVRNEMREDRKRIVVVEVLNFFEEVALVANLDIADDETLKRYFCGALKSYHSTLSPWIQTHRASIARPTMWCEIEKLVGRW